MAKTAEAAVANAPDWTFLTNHGHVLLCIADDPEIRVRDVAVRVGITERAAQRIVADLIAEEYLTATRVGRRNQYRVNSKKHLRHPLERESEIGVLLRLIRKAKSSARAS